MWFLPLQQYEEITDLLAILHGPLRTGVSENIPKQKQTQTGLQIISMCSVEISGIKSLWLQ